LTLFGFKRQNLWKKKKTENEKELEQKKKRKPATGPTREPDQPSESA
jgi:hypothetical protein